VPKVTKEHKVPQVLKALKGHLKELKGIQDPKAQQVLLDHKVLKVRLVGQVLQEHKDLKVITIQRKEPKGQQDLKEIKVPTLQVLQVLKVLQVI
jgi:hypothetical protein